MGHEKGSLDILDNHAAFPADWHFGTTFVALFLQQDPLTPFANT